MLVVGYETRICIICGEIVQTSELSLVHNITLAPQASRALWVSREMYFFTSQIIFLTLNFSTIWLVGCWLMLATQRWKRNCEYTTCTCSCLVFNCSSSLQCLVTVPRDGEERSREAPDAVEPGSDSLQRPDEKENHHTMEDILIPVTSHNCTPLCTRTHCVHYI